MSENPKSGDRNRCGGRHRRGIEAGLLVVGIWVAEVGVFSTCCSPSLCRLK